MAVDNQILSVVVRWPSQLLALQELGVEAEDFEEPYDRVWRFILRVKRDHGNVPSRAVVNGRFDVRWDTKVRRSDVPKLVHDLKNRRRKNDLVDMLMTASHTITDPDDVDDVIQQLHGGLNQLTMSNGANHLVDTLHHSFAREIDVEMHQRRAGQTVGIPTGFARFDAISGGLQPKRMVVVIGRTSRGKTWVNLLFVAEAIRQGAKVILYPLEMSVEETMFRLYTIFSQKMFKGRRTFRNLDLMHGRVNIAHFRKFLNILRDHYEGQLLVADVGKLHSPYTIERIEAEVEIHQPDMIWVDYLTLMKVPNSVSEDWQAVKLLSSGIKGIAMRHSIIGGCSAQVNREAIKGRHFLPRLEHISYGDAIGHDADQVFSIDRKDDKLYYALIKNRSGPEISRVACKFSPNDGLIYEVPDDEGVESD